MDDGVLDVDGKEDSSREGLDEGKELPSTDGVLDGTADPIIDGEEEGATDGFVDGPTSHLPHVTKHVSQADFVPL